MTPVLGEGRQYQVPTPAPLVTAMLTGGICLLDEGKPG